VTVNGGYHWCLAHNLKPSAQIVIDARPGNERFVEPAVPGCAYILASQCHPKVWDAVEGRPNVWIFHPTMRKDNDRVVAELDRYYGGPAWCPVSGGTTVVSRALYVLRISYDRAVLNVAWSTGAAAEEAEYGGATGVVLTNVTNVSLANGPDGAPVETGCGG
jgi:hypothetical protein